MKKTKRKFAVGMLLVFVVGGGWCWLVVQSYRSQIPRGTTFAEATPHLPEPMQYRIFTKDGQEYLAVFGPMQVVPPRFPSGDPVYVFDRNGKLLDWTSDSGDSEAFNGRWPKLFGGRFVSRDELTQWQQAQ